MEIDESSLKLLRAIGGNIAHLRAKGGLSLAELAAKVPIDVSALEQIENGQVDFDLDQLNHIAIALGVEPSLLLQRASLESALLPEGKRALPAND